MTSGVMREAREAATRRLGMAEHSIEPERSEWLMEAVENQIMSAAHAKAARMLGGSRVTSTVSEDIGSLDEPAFPAQSRPCTVCGDEAEHWIGDYCDQRDIALCSPCAGRSGVALAFGRGVRRFARRQVVDDLEREIDDALAWCCSLAGAPIAQFMEHRRRHDDAVERLMTLAMEARV